MTADGTSCLAIIGRASVHEPRCRPRYGHRGNPPVRLIGDSDSMARFEILQYRAGVLGRQIGLGPHMHEDRVPLIRREF